MFKSDFVLRNAILAQPARDVHIATQNVCKYFYKTLNRSIFSINRNIFHGQENIHDKKIYFL